MLPIPIAISTAKNGMAIKIINSFINKPRISSIINIEEQESDKFSNLTIH